MLNYLHSAWCKNYLFLAITAVKHQTQVSQMENSQQAKAKIHKNHYRMSLKYKSNMDHIASLLNLYLTCKEETLLRNHKNKTKIWQSHPGKDRGIKSFDYSPKPRERSFQGLAIVQQPFTSDQQRLFNFICHPIAIPSHWWNGLPSWQLKKKYVGFFFGK